ncbi:rhomboid family intramembrane serine protease [bacterium]|nr:MAG: rhomboid family intramembrane serine protease [bacterium]
MQDNHFQPNTQFSLFPPAIKNLLIINGLVYVAQFTPITSWILDNYFSLWPIASGNFYPWQLVSYMFMHGNLSHIFFNLFALWMFGLPLEQKWGSSKFLTYYFITGIGAGILQLLVSDAIVIGASGAVYGILLAFGMLYPNRYIYMLFPPIPMKAKYFVLMFGFLELISGVSGLNSGIAHFAHLGGMVFGFALLKLWKVKGEAY